MARRSFDSPLRLLQSEPAPTSGPPAPTDPSPLSPGPAPAGADVVPLLQPGSFVRLRDHPDDLPPFQLIQCHGGRCWVRQQAWGGLVQWEVARRRLTTAA